MERKGYFKRERILKSVCGGWGVGQGGWRGGTVEERRKLTYGVVNDILGAGIVVYVNGDAAQGRDFG